MGTAAKLFKVRRHAGAMGGLGRRRAIPGLFLPRYRSDGDIVGASNGFRKVMDAINPVLEPNGFSAVSVLDEGSKGWWSVTSGNTQGARVGIFGRTKISLTLDLPVDSESCSAGELTGVAP